MKCSINIKLLFIKAHYFLFFAGMSTVIPYLPIIAKKIVISASMVGLMSTVISCVGMLAKPLFGAVSDRFKKLKPLLIVIMVSTMVTYLGIDFIPLPNYDGFEGEVYLSGTILPASAELKPCIQFDTTEQCMTLLRNSSQASIIYANCSLFRLLSSEGLHYSENYVSSGKSFNLTFTSDEPAIAYTTTQSCYHAGNIPSYISSLYENSSYACLLHFRTNMTDDCFHSLDNDIPIPYMTYQFWLFLAFAIISRAGVYVLVSLSDTACFDLLGDQVKEYGKQRLWGSIGFGIFSLIGGVANDWFSDPNGDHNYSPGFYIMVGVFTLDILALYFMDVKQPVVNEKIWENVGQLLKKMRVLSFLLAVFVVGAMTGFQWYYFFLYLNSLGATTLLLGLSFFVQCFLGEVPFFFISGWTIQKIGYLNALSVTFLCFGVRFLLYSYIQNPWFVLPIELMEGPTYGLFYAVVASYAKIISPPGAEATVQGLIGGTFEGLGYALGGLVGGIVFDYLGGRMAYRCASFIAFGCCAIHVLCHLLHIIYMKKSTDKSDKEKQCEKVAK